MKEEVIQRWKRMEKWESEHPKPKSECKEELTLWEEERRRQLSDEGQGGRKENIKIADVCAEIAVNFFFCKCYVKSNERFN